jgi:hypothetical protein
MNTEKINAAAEDFYPLLAKDEDSIIYNSFRRVAFTSGIDYAAANPDVIGCVKVEDALAFAEWVLNHQIIGYGKDTTELFQIYQQQKQQG